MVTVKTDRYVRYITSGLGDRYFMATPLHEVGKKTPAGILEAEVAKAELGQTKKGFEVRNRRVQFNFPGMRVTV